MKIDFGRSYKHKIKHLRDLLTSLDQSPRKSRVVMCHGVFDVVHPGHIRHLLFAKSKAEILIVSITADQHINKGSYRPHIPQDLRAMNLAVLDFVDFVLIDENDTPLKNIIALKPEFFAKGYEYSPDIESNLKTNAEISAVESYGGQVIFTPGDYVMSSSALISSSPPNIRIEKLLLLMEHAKIDFDDLKNALKNFSGKHVHVIGDSIVDSYSYCSLMTNQAKTPTLSVQFERKEDFVGGAGIVAAHLRAAGAEVSFSTVLGKDSLGELVKHQLKKWDINDLSNTDSTRSTTNKNAITVGDYRVIKIDTVNNDPISDQQLRLICKGIQKSKADAFVVSDFRHGIFNQRTLNQIISSIPNGKFKTADSQVASRWGNILDFKNFNLITPNEKEARFSLGDQDSGIRTLSSKLYEKSKCEVLIMKLSDKGIITCLDSKSDNLENYFVMESFVDNLVDPVGAGDALLAYSTLALLTTNNAIVASILGNLAAACECEFNGNIPITPELILKKISAIEKKVNFEI